MAFIGAKQNEEKLASFTLDRHTYKILQVELVPPDERSDVDDEDVEKDDDLPCDEEVKKLIW